MNIIGTIHLASHHSHSSHLRHLHLFTTLFTLSTLFTILTWCTITFFTFITFFIPFTVLVLFTVLHISIIVCRSHMLHTVQPPSSHCSHISQSWICVQCLPMFTILRDNQHIPVNHNMHSSYSSCSHTPSRCISYVSVSKDCPSQGFKECVCSCIMYLCIFWLEFRNDSFQRNDDHQGCQSEGFHNAPIFIFKGLTERNSRAKVRWHRSAFHQVVTR